MLSKVIFSTRSSVTLRKIVRFQHTSYNKILNNSSSTELPSAKNQHYAPPPVRVAYDVYDKRQTNDNREAPPLIIMDAIFGSRKNWVENAEFFQKNTNPPRQIIAMDQRNHGDSPFHVDHGYENLAADIKLLVKERNLKKAALLGFSSGARAVMMFSLQYPELVDRIMIIDVSPVSMNTYARVIKPLMEAINRVEFQQGISLEEAKELADLEMKKTIESDKLRRHSLVNLVQGEDGNFKWTYNSQALLDNFENLWKFDIPKNGRFDGPTLFFVGGKSQFVPNEDRPKIRELFPQAQFQVIEDGTHFLHYEKPDDFRHYCVEFLNS